MRRKIIRDKHVDLVHGGAHIVTEGLAKEYDWPEMGKLVKDELSKCIRCKMYNPRGGKRILFVTSLKWERR